MIVNVASMGGRIGMPRASIYAASKFGLTGFGESIWSEMRDREIRVMTIYPGFVHTEGFPMDDLLGSRLTRGLVMEVDRVAEALCLGMERRNSEVVVQLWWYPLYLLTVLAGPVQRRIARIVDKLVVRKIRP